MVMRGKIQPFSGKWVWLFQGMCRLVLAVTILTGVPQSGYAERRQDVHGDIIALGAKRAEGTIYRIDTVTGDDGQSLVVIDESIFTVDSRTVFRTRSGVSTDISHFKVGDTVHYYFVDSLLTKMWVSLPDETNVDPSQDERQSNAENDVQIEQAIRLENGVWKN